MKIKIFKKIVSIYTIFIIINEYKNRINEYYNNNILK